MLKVIVKMRNGMAVTTTSKQEAGVAARLTHRARMRPQEEVTLICGEKVLSGEATRNVTNVLPKCVSSQRSPRCWGLVQRHY